MARGTEFEVKRGYQAFTVTLVHGIVDVRANNERAGSGVRLYPGMKTRVSPNGEISPPERVDVWKAIEWRNGVLHFDDVELNAVIADLNEYSKRPIAVADDSISGIHVSGSVRVGEIGDWLRGLASAFDISVDDKDQERRLPLSTSRVVSCAMRRETARTATQYAGRLMPFTVADEVAGEATELQASGARTAAHHLSVSTDRMLHPRSCHRWLPSTAHRPG